LDWLDGDDFPEPRGAEKSHYLSLTPPYSARNGLLFTLGELGRVEGFTATVRAQLDGTITVVPANNTKINVNTAPLEVLAALFPAVNPQVLDQFVRSREETPVHGPSELRGRLGIDPRVPVETLNLTDVRSEFFTIHALATVAPISQGLAVVVQRRAATVTPIYWNPTFLTATSEGEA
jgi:general secretion pathway protein K